LPLNNTDAGLRASCSLLYDCPATSNTDVFMCMNPGKVLTASLGAGAWSRRTRATRAPYPRVSIWQGTHAIRARFGAFGKGAETGS